MRINANEFALHQFKQMQRENEQFDGKINKNYEKQADNEVTKDDVTLITSKLNDFLEPVRRHLKFELHEELGEYYVKVINPEDDEVIREIPPEKILDMYAAMIGFMGLLVDEKV